MYTFSSARFADTLRLTMDMLFSAFLCDLIYLFHLIHFIIFFAFFSIFLCVVEFFRWFSNVWRHFFLGLCNVIVACTCFFFFAWPNVESTLSHLTWLFVGCDGCSVNVVSFEYPGNKNGKDKWLNMWLEINVEISGAANAYI